MLIKKIGSGELVKQFSEQVTHLVVFCDSDGMPKTTIKFHQCILAGCHVVSFTCTSDLHLYFLSSTFSHQCCW